MAHTPRRYGSDPWFADDPSDVRAALEMIFSVWDKFKRKFEKEQSTRPFSKK